MDVSTKINYNERHIDKIKAYILCIAIIIFFGLRPISGRYFGDTLQYAGYYQKYLTTREYYSGVNEWLWSLIMTSCANIGLSVNGWFLLIDFLYVSILLLACRRIKNNNIYLLVLFFVSAFLFYSGAVNGLRVGLATSIFFLAFTYIFTDKKREKILAVLLFIASFFIHRSIVLPILCLFFSIHFFKNIKIPVFFWFLSIILLLLFGNFFASILNSYGLFGFDDRMVNYITGERTLDIGYDKGGFRWDFIFYSFAPIAFGWYITVEKKVFDKFYITILNTYILANTFWILVMYAIFSNRFASLSWFLYPLLFAYPLIKFKIWKNQNKITALLLFLNMFFTYLMWLR